MKESIKTIIFSVILPAIISITSAIIFLKYKTRRETKYKKLYSDLNNHIKLYKDLDSFMNNEALTLKGFFLKRRERNKILKSLNNEQEFKSNIKTEREETLKEIILWDDFYNIYQSRFHNAIESVMRLSTPDIQKIAKKININYRRVKWNIERLQEDHPQPDEKELQLYKKDEKRELGIFCIQTAPLFEKLLPKLEKITEYKK